MNRTGFAVTVVALLTLVGVARAEQGYYYPDVPFVIENKLSDKIAFGIIFIRPGINTDVTVLSSQQSGTAYAERDIQGAYSIQFQASINPAPNGGPDLGSVSCSAEVQSANGQYPPNTPLNIAIYSQGGGSYGCSIHVSGGGGEPTFSCPGGILYGGSPVTGSPWQLVCGSDTQNWLCTPRGWHATGKTCTTITSTCDGGTLCDGTPVQGTPNQIVCGLDLQDWQCTAPGWRPMGSPCTCNNP